jgi:hypothetical protein
LTVLPGIATRADARVAVSSPGFLTQPAVKARVLCASFTRRYSVRIISGWVELLQFSGREHHPAYASLKKIEKKNIKIHLSLIEFLYTAQRKEKKSVFLHGRAKAI